MPVKLVPYKIALRESVNIAGEELLPQNMHWFAKSLIECCPIIQNEKDGVQYVVYEDLKFFVQNINKFLDQQDLTMLLRKRGPKTKELDVLEFVESKDYMNMRGHVYPEVANALYEIWHSKKETYSEAVLSGCLTGDTKIRVHRRKNHHAARLYSIEQLYLRENNLHWKGWQDKTLTTRVHCLQDETFGYHEIKKVVYSGSKRVYEVVTETGKVIKATADHKFLVPEGTLGADYEGFKTLAELKIGDEVICRSERGVGEGRKTPVKRRWVYSIPFHPRALRNTVCGKNYKRQVYAKLKYEAHMNGLSIKEFVDILRHHKQEARKLTYLPKGVAIHHKDGNPRNDRLSNLEILTKAEHDKHHGVPNIKNFRWPVPVAEKITSIKDKGVQPTYDIMMQSPYHNFLANEFVVHNSTGIGKSFIVEMCCAYMLYKLSNYWDPQVEMDLAPGSPLYIVFQSRTERSATNILFRPFYARVRRTKYFTEKFPFRKDITSQMLFPNEIIVAPFSGSDDAVLGLTVVGGGITELNRMAYIEDSKKRSRTSSNDGQAYDQAVEIHKTLRRRIVGRTMELGKTWGLLVLDAAHEYGDDFTDRKIKEAEAQPKGKKTIFVYNKKQWEVRPQTKYSGEKFYVEVGTEKRRSRVLLSKEQAIDPSRVEEIPIEYKSEFDKDVEGALKDFGGISVSSRSSAIPYKEQIEKACTDFDAVTGGQQLFRRPVVQLEDYLTPAGLPDWSGLVNREYMERMFLDPNIKMAGHVDPSLNHCLAGIALSHISGWKLLDKISEYDPNTRSVKQRKNVRSPMIMFDGLLGIEAMEGEEIDLELLQSLGIYLFQECNVAILSIDSYQSVQMRQAWANVGLVTGHISVDDSTEPYTRLRSGYREGRIIHPDHVVYRKEIATLQFNGAKYDHLPGGSKDITDAAAGSFYLAETHLTNFDISGMNVSERRRLMVGRAGRRLLPRRYATR